MASWVGRGRGPRHLGHRGHRLLALVAALIVLLLSACQATVQVGIDAHGDGSGTITVTARLDAEAAASVPHLAQELRTSDLVKAGWRVDGPKAAPGGGVVVSASKPFRNSAEAAAVVAELSGPSGPFHDLRIERRQSLFSTRTTFRGTVDLTCGLHCFADPQLQQDLGGADLGLDPAKLQADAGVILNRLFTFEVAVRLPGSVQSSNAPAQAGNGAQWRPNLGDKAVLTATAHAWNTTHILLAVVLGLLALATAVVLPLASLRRRATRR